MNIKLKFIVFSLLFYVIEFHLCVYGKNKSYTLRKKREFPTMRYKIFLITCIYQKRIGGQLRCGYPCLICHLNKN